MQADPVMIKASELMRLGLMPSAEEIKGGLVSVELLSILFTSAHIDIPAICQDILGVDIASSQVKAKLKA